MKFRIFCFLIAFSILIDACSKKDASPNGTDPNANNKSVGTSGNDFLSASKFQSIKIEIVYMPGYAPDNAATNNLVNFLNALINKPGGIQVSQRQIEASGKTTLTLDEIKGIETNTRTVFNSGTTLGVYILFADADYSTPNVLGVAYKNTSLVIFGKKVQESSGGVNQTSLTKLESTAEQHEFGHLLGLVNLGTTMVTAHEDTAHAKHCTNTGCLMYYITQTNMMGGILMSAPIPTLDDNCRNDLRANGGK